MADLQALSEHLGHLLIQLSDAEMRKLEMSIARKLRTSQKKESLSNLMRMELAMYLVKIVFEIKRIKSKIRCSTLSKMPNI